MSRIWTRTGKRIVDALGRLVSCIECPCVGTGSGTATGTGVGTGSVQTDCFSIFGVCSGLPSWPALPLYYSVTFPTMTQEHCGSIGGCDGVGGNSYAGTWTLETNGSPCYWTNKFQFISGGCDTLTGYLEFALYPSCHDAGYYWILTVSMVTNSAINPSTGVPYLLTYKSADDGATLNPLAPITLLYDAVLSNPDAASYECSGWPLSLTATPL